MVACTVLFVTGLIVTYALAMILAINNVTGIRGKPIENNPWNLEHQLAADFTVLGMVAIGIAILTWLRRKFRLSPYFLAGQWAAIVLGCIMILSR